MRIVALTALPLALVACMANMTEDDRIVPPRYPDQPDSRLCNQDALMAADGFVGRQASQELAAEMMQLSGATIFQWVPEGSAVTMDYRANRLRVSLDGQNRVTKTTCG